MSFEQHCHIKCCATPIQKGYSSLLLKRNKRVDWFLPLPIYLLELIKKKKLTFTARESNVHFKYLSTKAGIMFIFSFLHLDRSLQERRLGSQWLEKVTADMAVLLTLQPALPTISERLHLRQNIIFSRMV